MHQSQSMTAFDGLALRLIRFTLTRAKPKQANDSRIVSDENRKETA